MSGNCKVHFALCTSLDRDLACMDAVGARYALFTAYPYIEKRRDSYRYDDLIINRAGFKHVIVDSGLFTLMWGGGKDRELTEGDLREWMHRLVAFARENDIRNASFVECDCQKLMGPELAWELRREMRELLPDKEIINVFHLEDGPDGFERLVDFSDYIAISVPELRFNQGSRYRNTVCALSRMARRIKPGVKIHLLGCTEKGLLERNRFCTTADSSTWSSSMRWGQMSNKRHFEEMDEDAAAFAYQKIRECADRRGYKQSPDTEHNKFYLAGVYYSLIDELQKYTRACGPQD